MFPRRRSFLDKDPPPGYIPGIGRGATGFTTRSDVGNARLPPQRNITIDSDDEGRFDDADGDNGLLGDFGDKEDEDADAIYKSIDDRMKMRSKKRVRLEDEEESNLEKISSQFVDLKKSLGSVTEAQWANLPEAGDLTKRNKRLRDEANKDRVNYAAPDTLVSALNGSSTDSTINISELTQQRSKLLESKIDANFEMDGEDFDQKEYLQEISTFTNTNEEEVQRINNLLIAYNRADSSKPQGWIARARLEEFRKNFEQARKLIRQGCEHCPRDEDIWLENVRLNQHDVKFSKVIVSDGVKWNKRSLKLWMKAVELEQEIFYKKRVLRRGLESIPTSEELWGLLVELEEDEDTKKKVLEKALELIPKSEKFWLTLISMQTYEDAKSTLNKARKALGGDNVQVWLTAARLEFQNNPHSDKAAKLLKKAFKECKSITRDEWFGYAVKFEDEGLTYLATLIVTEVINGEDEDYDLWIEDSNKYVDHIFILKTILNQIVIHFPKKISIWKRLINLYKKNFDLEELYKIFENTVELFPKNALFWLMYSKEVWKSSNDLNKAKEILNRALNALPTNTDIWCAIIKLAVVDSNVEQANKVFVDASANVQDERIWYKWVTFERHFGKSEKAWSIVNEGLTKFPESWKMYLQKSQLLIEKGDVQGARSVLALGTRQIPQNHHLWIELARVDEKLGQVAKARSDLDLGMLKIKNNLDTIWLEKLELERRAGNQSQAGVILTRALKEFPSSSLLWTFQLKYHTKKSQRKTLYQDALGATNNDVRILILIGVNFWADGKFDKAQRWFERAILADEDFGDAWAWNYNFLTKRKQLVDADPEVDVLLKKISQVEPRHGDVWPLVSKRIENYEKGPVEVLKLVAQELMQ